MRLIVVTCPQSMFSRKALSRPQDRVVASLSFVVIVLAVTAQICGCGNVSSSKPVAGTISVTTSTGAAMTTGTVAVSSSVNLSMTPTGGIGQTGVDWTMTCQGNPVTGSISNGACGTLAPAHTADGGTSVYTAPSVVPIGTNVAITAAVTGNPSQTSTATFTIVSLPIVVQFYNGEAPPASMTVGTSKTLGATVSNDLEAAGVIWTAVCNGSACGSFNPTVTASGIGTSYTAPTVVPSGGTVTITATSLTDTTKSATAALTVTTHSAPAAVTVSVAPSSIYVETTGSARTTTIEAIVGNGSAGATVNWTLSCSASNCGTITSTTASGAAATYVGPSSVPSGGTVTITAISTDNAAISASAVANIVTTAPIVVKSSSMPPATLIAGSQTTLAATVMGDPNNLGVNWTATCGSTSACGTFNLSPAHTASGGNIVYTAPAAAPTGSVVVITAASAASTPADPAIDIASIAALPPSLSFTATPPSTMASVAQASVSATVANDVSPGGVNWSVQCGSVVPGACGWVVPAHTASGATAVYTAPPVTSTGTLVTIKATSAADSSVAQTSGSIAISPSTTLAVDFVPSLPAQMQPNATVNLIASVSNDATNAGIDWQVCASGCGFFTVTPAVPAIPATATTPYIPAVPAVTATSVSGWSNGLLIPYTAPSEASSSANVAVAAFAHADRTKAISRTIAVTVSDTSPALHGLVQAGSQPVVGASVALYAAGTSGYASAASQIAVSSTVKDGSFTIPADYICPVSSSQMYLVATGGSVGGSSANPNLALMTALGSCANLPSATVVVNEVTTIASAYVTAPFSANDALTGNSSYLYLGTSSGNLIGLANAFAAANNLVDISTGQAKYFTPAANAAVPFVLIDTLADALNACAATSGGVEGDGSACSILFVATDLLGASSGTNDYSGSIAPSDTLQAAFNIAQHPVSDYGYELNIGGLMSLATNSSPFQPILPSTSTPNDFSVSLDYTGGGGLSSSSTVGSFAIDASGNVWITDTAAGSVIEWNPTAAALSPSTGFAAGGGPIAIDANGNVWTSGNGVLNELTNLGDVVEGSPYAGVAGGGSDMAFDAQDNLWIANGSGVSEFDNLGVELSPASGFTNTGISGVTAVGIDSSNNVWLGNPNIVNPANASFSELTNPGGALIADSVLEAGVPGGGEGTGGPSFLPELAANGTGDVWGITTDGGTLCEVTPYLGNGTILVESCSNGSFSSQSSELFFGSAKGLAFDGAAVLWIASGNAGPSILPYSPSLIGGYNAINPTYLSSPSLAAGPLRLAVDGSGNVWVLLANNTVTEYVGVATPVVTPTALAVKNKKLAAKP